MPGVKFSLSAAPTFHYQQCYVISINQAVSFYTIRIQINHQPDATIFQFIILTFIYSSTCFGRFPPIIRGRPARPRTQYDCHHDTKVKPEAANAVIELLMMGGKTPEHVEL
jgi:hypothetical protein